jgi:hypothetical protein
MKKKHRKIIVDGIPYAWTIHKFDSTLNAQIWIDKKPLFLVECKEESITPDFVATEIRKHNAKEKRHG